jgi:hypothetical protein
VGLLAALDAALGIAAALSLSAYDCGRVVATQLTAADEILLLGASVGTIVVVPGIVAGVLAIKIRLLRSGRIWFGLTALLAVVLAIGFVFQPANTPDPVPHNCRINL